MNNFAKRRSLISAIALVLLGIAVGGITAATQFAEADPSDSSIINGQILVPYDGFLMLDNAGLNGTRQIRFELYDAPDSQSPIWNETQDVTFLNGRFNVGLGAVTSITQTILDAEQVYLAMAVDNGSGTFVPLNGRQAIEPVPYAAWSANAADFNVAGDLTVGNSMTVSGPTSLLNNLEVSGTLSDPNSDVEIADGLSVDGSVYDPSGELVLNDAVIINGVVKDNDSNLVVDDNLDINGAASVGNTLNVGGQTTIAGNIRLTGNIQDTDSDLTISDNLKVNGTLLRKVYDDEPSGDGNLKIGSSNIPVSRNICFISRVTGINANNEHCTLSISSGNWRYDQRETSCEVMCFTWN